MNADVKEKWIAALLSGKYQQDVNKLRTDKGFCCLGVLCDLYDPTKWNGMIYDVYDEIHLPVDVQIWSGINPRWGVLAEDIQDRDGAYLSLTSANDGGCSFSQIADLIRYFL